MEKKRKQMEKPVKKRAKISAKKQQKVWTIIISCDIIKKIK